MEDVRAMDPRDGDTRQNDKTVFVVLLYEWTHESTNAYIHAYMIQMCMC